MQGQLCEAARRPADSQRKRSFDCRRSVLRVEGPCEHDFRFMRWNEHPIFQMKQITVQAKEKRDRAVLLGNGPVKTNELPILRIPF